MDAIKVYLSAIVGLEKQKCDIKFGGKTLTNNVK
jgi:hypothetical protein